MGDGAPVSSQQTLMQHLQQTSVRPESRITLPPPENPPMYYAFNPPYSLPNLHAHWVQPIALQYQYDPTAGHSSQPLHRKAVRAVHACESCRTKKSKCDEARPSCGKCQQDGAKCEYRNLPVPKQDRSILQFIESVQQSMDTLLQEVLHLRGLVEERLPRANSPENTPQSHNFKSKSNLTQVPVDDSPSTGSVPDEYHTPTQASYEYYPCISAATSQESQTRNGTNPPHPLGEAGVPSTQRHIMVQRGYAEPYSNFLDMPQGELATVTVDSTAAHIQGNWPTEPGFFHSIEKEYVCNGEYNKNFDLSSHRHAGAF